MDERYLECLEFVFAREGKISNDKDDHGGLTNYGVTQKNYDKWRVKHNLPTQSVVKITLKEVRDFYFEEYWSEVHADRFPPPIDLALFDAAVNSGPERSAIFLQRVVGADVDGDPGDQTVHCCEALVDKLGPKEVAMQVVHEREKFIYDIVERDATQGKFLRGWLNRLSALRGAINEI